MDIEVAIREYVVGLPDVSALVGTRGYQLVLPQECTYPAFRVQKLVEPVEYTHDGPEALRRADIQIDAVAQEASGEDPYANAIALANAIDAGLSGYIGPMGTSESPGLDVRGVFREDRKPFYESEELRLVRVLQLYTVWYRAT